MKDRSARKQFLIAESELSRSRFIEDYVSLTAGFQKIGTCAEPLKPAISAAALAISGFAAFQEGFRKPKHDAGKSSWPWVLLKGAGIASTVWLALQTPRRGR
jgi:hypothetical protein